jgi:hypothetical protein
MSNVTATATLESDINFTLIKAGSNLQNESAGLAYSQALTNGTGSEEINYGVIASGNLPSGGKQYFDLRALEKEVFDLVTSVQFNQVKSIIFENRQTLSGVDIHVYSTGTLALDTLFNGGTGNVLIKPKSCYIYSDPTAGLVVDGTNREVILGDGAVGSGAAFTLVVVGTTG